VPSLGTRADQDLAEEGAGNRDPAIDTGAMLTSLSCCRKANPPRRSSPALGRFRRAILR